MYLQKIKLVGFKSFVEPTTINLAKKITAIVGPNGCGKSNVIDAIRWVMGESSAKQLRSEAMSDVIFNGSSQRKPLGRASIELTFDNSDASFGGEYAKYSTIAVKREIERGGTSTYFLNNSRCRRKDIVDLFLGTGLGSNSYAIIEQGTISQFIEAKPEDLRLYLEEASGISRYKEKRKETESHINHTKENLNRLNDIRTEIEQQLKHLKTQANTAERYKKLAQEQRFTQAQWHSLAWQELQENKIILNTQLEQAQIQLQDNITAQLTCESTINANKQEYDLQRQSHDTTQEKFYTYTNKITQQEQQLQYRQDEQTRLQQNIAKIANTVINLQHNYELEQLELNKVTQEESELNQQQPAIKTQLQQIDNELQAKNLACEQNQQNIQTLNTTLQQTKQNLAITQTKLANIKHNISNEQKHLEKLQQEFATCNQEQNTAIIENLEQQQQELEQQNIALQNKHKELQQQINNLKQVIQINNNELQKSRQQQQILAGKNASLSALQEASLKSNDAQQQRWLQEKNLFTSKRLLQNIHVETGYEKAIETVMTHYLDAFCVDNFDLLMQQNWHNRPSNNVTIFATQTRLNQHNLHKIDNVNQATSIIIASKNLPRLSDKISATFSLPNFVYNIYIAQDWHEAQQHYNNLANHESIVTMDGIWFGQNWLYVLGKNDLKAGVLQREQELTQLQNELQIQDTLIKEYEQRQQQEQNNLKILEHQAIDLNKNIQSCSASLHKIQGELVAKKHQIVYMQQRQKNLTNEIQHHETTLEQYTNQLTSLNITYDELNISKNQVEQQLQPLQNNANLVRQEIEVLRQQLNKLRNTLHNNRHRCEILTNQSQFLQNNLKQHVNKLQDLQQEQIKHQKNYDDNVQPLEQQEIDLHKLINEKLEIAQILEQYKKQLQNQEYEIKVLEEKNRLYNKNIIESQEQLNKTQLQIQEIILKQEYHSQQVIDLDFILDDLLVTLTENTQQQQTLSLQNLEETSNHLKEKIKRLGSINLTAYDEYIKQQERKNYLDEQNQDLLDALATLESAINKIDKDTKDKFHTTYTTVNNRFKEIFPRIFNGGQASLQLTENNLLETGISITAQPPGKRNSSIHLLSGGEKALTAIALIFAIFQLNPAPFCLLDEVDAPLDDTNVLRFSNLLKEISLSVQLIFISHNKLTLEIADQLTGVTMHEPGVSRIVDVNIENLDS